MCNVVGATICQELSQVGAMHTAQLTKVTISGGFSQVCSLETSVGFVDGKHATSDWSNLCSTM